MSSETPLTGKECFFNSNEIIVSKTDLKGRITYVNRTFMNVAVYTEQELLGKPHNIIRHPDMPRCVFKLLWDTLAEGKEIFAYVINKTKNGDHYWVLAHVTPSYDKSGNLNGYHSNRRVPKREILDNVIIPTYKQLLDIEKQHSNKKNGMNASFEALVSVLTEKGMAYDEFIFSL